MIILIIIKRLKRKWFYNEGKIGSNNKSTFLTDPWDKTCFDICLNGAG